MLVEKASTKTHLSFRKVWETACSETWFRLFKLWEYVDLRFVAEMFYREVRHVEPQFSAVTTPTTSMRCNVHPG